MGPDRLERIKIFAGDVVERKKPHPDIYNLAKVETLACSSLTLALRHTAHCIACCEL